MVIWQQTTINVLVISSSGQITSTVPSRHHGIYGIIWMSSLLMSVLRMRPVVVAFICRHQALQDENIQTNIASIFTQCGSWKQPFSCMVCLLTVQKNKNKKQKFCQPSSTVESQEAMTCRLGLHLLYFLMHQFVQIVFPLLLGKHVSLDHVQS